MLCSFFSLIFLMVHGMEPNNLIAPFILKTYQMVSDPCTDNFISWGRTNNTFIVTDPLDFSRRILSAYFKHNNFSSFVRQLNTYGFKKVDPDRWEFANRWFLRGQKHLLKNIVRRKYSRRNSFFKFGDVDEEEMVMEIARLKQEQEALEEEVKRMNKRLEATEKRPQQMMSFLCQVVEDPDILPRIFVERDDSRQLEEKKRCLIESATTSSSCSSVIAVTKDADEEVGIIGKISASLSPGVTAKTTKDPAFWMNNQRQLAIQGEPRIDYQTFSSEVTDFLPLELVANSGMIGNITANTPPLDSGYSNCKRGKGQIGYYNTEVPARMEGRPTPPYPLSLFGGGFWF